MEVNEFFRKTRELIEAGWCQGVFEYRDGDETQYCLLGAMGKVWDTQHSVRLLDMKMVLYPYLPDEYRCGGMPMIVRWNDNPRRTKAEVLELLDRVIESSEA